MALWLLGPDPDGNCCDCTGRTSPCDTCGEPDPCPCSHNFGPDLSLTNTFSTYSEAQFIIDNYTNNCFGVIQYIPTFTVASFTATETVDGFIFAARSTRTPDPVDRVSHTMQVGFYAAAGTLTIDYSTTSDGSSGTVGNSAVLVVCSGGVYSNVDSQSSTSTTGTFIFTLSAAALYIVRFQGTSKINASYVESSFDFSFSANMVIAPAVALYDDSGTTRQLEACPKMLLPPLTESTGDWYASEAAAQTATTTFVKSCIAYFLFADTGWFSSQSISGFTVSGTRSVSGSSSIALVAYISVNGNQGDTLTYTWNNAPNLGQLVVYAYDGTQIFSSVSATSPIASSVLPYTGRYIVFLGQNTLVSTSSSGTLSSSGTISINQVQALYATVPLLDCPARLNC